MPETELTPLEEVHNLLQPQDMILRQLWLFADAPVAILHPIANDWQADHEEVARQRVNAVTALWRDGGVQALRDLAARSGVNRGILGYAIGRATMPEGIKDDLLRSSLLSIDEQEAAAATGIVIGASSDAVDRTKRLHAWCEIARVEEWPTFAVVRLLLLCDSNPHTWELASTWSAEVKRAYWEKQWLLAPGLSSAEVNIAAREMMAAGRAAQALQFVVFPYKDKITPALLAELLVSAAERGQETGAQSLRVYDVESAFDLLDRSGEFGDDKLAELEFKLLVYLEHSRRRGRLAIHRVMAKEPSLFRDLICLVFPAKNGLEDESDDNKPSAREIRIATLCWGLLRNWQTVPGLRNGDVDRAVLEDWIVRARALCGEADRLSVCDAKIGNMLAHAPVDLHDGIWPCRAVREILPVFGSDNLEAGLVTGGINMRGMTVRDPRDGGEQERTLQAKYVGWAKTLRLTAPRAANVLDQIARHYDADAKREDDRVKRMDW